MYGLHSVGLEMFCMPKLLSYASASSDDDIMFHYSADHS